MNINGIPGALTGLGAGAAGAAARTLDGGESQQGAFGALLQALTQAQAGGDQAVADLATGADGDLHDAVLAVEMESLTFDLAVQIRNRLVDAYQEIFRMSV
jgi:flagellar hook-basal body complex protein FliE